MELDVYQEQHFVLYGFENGHMWVAAVFKVRQHRSMGDGGLSVIALCLRMMIHISN